MFIFVGKPEVAEFFLAELGGFAVCGVLVGGMGVLLSRERGKYSLRCACGVVVVGEAWWMLCTGIFKAGEVVVQLCSCALLWLW